MKSLVLIMLLSFLACDPGNGNESDIRENINYQLVGGPCEGCEAIFEYEPRKLSNIDTLPDFASDGPSLVISGTVRIHNSKVPAEGVILYIHHTNQKGIYPTKGDEKGWGKRHGYLRGWIKTNEKGEYSFYTRIPGAYPERTNPRHIHLTVLEPNGKYYYVEDYLFEDDPLLTNDRISRKNPRGGNGYVLKPALENGLYTAKRDIELGKNIPGYDR